MSFESTFKIRSFHTDRFGHVNNARYLELLEEARWQFGEYLGLVDLLNAERLAFIIMQMNLRFRLPIVEGDTILISTRLVNLGTAIGEVEQRIRKQGETRLAALGKFHFVLIDRDSGASVPIAGKIRSLLMDLIPRQAAVDESSERSDNPATGD